MESPSSLSVEVEVPGILRIYKDGTVERLIDRGTVPLSSQLGDDFKEAVASKDVLIDPQTGVFIRFYLPRLQVSDGKVRVPLLVYFTEGLSASNPLPRRVITAINKVASEANVICLSVEYRRAPEHRLPAAYDDCFAVLEWLDCQATAAEGVSVDPWLDSHADFSKVFLAGDSAGANIVHQVGVLASQRNWQSLRVQGAIFVHPFFAGEERIGSKVGPDMERFHKLVDLLWSISLPAGTPTDKDHPFCNPVGPHSPPLSSLLYARMLVFAAGKDMLRDRGILYYEALKKAGKDVDFVMTEGEDHVFHLLNPKSENAPIMMKRISDFMNSSYDGCEN